jgi:hypothetical protein
VVAVLGFHGPAVTSRLLALWPVCILATFVLFGRRWSERGLLLAALAVAPFAALLALQVMDAPRNPPFALEWVATALPVIAIGLGRGLSLLGRWSDIRTAAVVAAVILVVAALDQTTRVDPTSRFDLTPLVEEATGAAEPGDTIVYAPDVIGDLITREVSDVEVVAIEDVSTRRLARSDRVVVVGAFAFDRDQSLPAVLRLVEDLASERELVDEHERTEAKVWTFE